MKNSSVRFIGQNFWDNTTKHQKEDNGMIIAFLKELFCINPEERAVDAEYETFQDELSLAGLNEEELRSMDPDDRVAALEQAKLDPYDYIYLAC